MPSADFCCGIKAPCDAFSHDSATHSRSPEVSSTAFRTQSPDLQPVPLIDMDFAIIGSLVRHRMPQIRFLYIDSCVCSTLLSDPASRRRPCASLSLHLHQVVKRTFTFELSNMRGTPNKRSEPFGSLLLSPVCLIKPTVRSVHPRIFSIRVRPDPWPFHSVPGFCR